MYKGDYNMSEKSLKRYIETLNMEGLALSQVLVIQDLISLAGKHYTNSTEVDGLTKVELDVTDNLEKRTPLNKYEIGEILGPYWKEALQQIENAYYQGFIDAIGLTNQMANYLL